ncbi:MAG: hypothetical protein H7A21_12840 [Spirochaetales bacterium]|nr:hypothetical protein [Leptospiraceae bacterium]MCP5482314.1 hypothetical protein [Spirochaetales bacterium]MCP5484247.1 hypothetical protein [Spirochaetales bacterium]
MKRRSINTAAISFLDLISGAVGAGVLLFLAVSVLPRNPADPTEIIDEALAAQLQELQLLKDELGGMRFLVNYRGLEEEAHVEGFRDRILRSRNHLEAIEDGLHHLMDVYRRSEETRVRMETTRAERQEELQTISARTAELQRQFYERRFVFITMNFSERPDVDLHVIDPAGNRFFYGCRDANHCAELRSARGLLTADDTEGPGLEVWYVNEMPSGRYQVCINLYDRSADNRAEVYVLVHSGRRIERQRAVIELARGGPRPGQPTVRVDSDQGPIDLIKVADVIVTDSGEARIQMFGDGS